MKLATFTAGRRTRLGIVEGETIADLAPNGQHNSLDMIGLLNGGTAALESIRSAGAGAPRLALAEVRLEAPILRPRKFLGLGGSYESHLAEVAAFGIPRPTHQTWFNKQVTSVNGPYGDIHMPRCSPTLDYEGELAIIIGRQCRHVKASQAHEVIAGYTICNDVSVREWQMRASTATLGKSFDTHGPIGPWIVTADELREPEQLALRTWVNGELRQDGNTRELIYSFGDMIEELSAVFTLEPGDILSTGTPAGVGATRQPPAYLRVGDVCKVAIEGIGLLENRVVAEP